MSSSNAAVAQRVGRHALIYLFSNFLMRGLVVGLTPFYTRTMSTDDFALVAIANTVVPALTILIGFAIHGCIARLYQDEATDLARRRFLGTLFVFSSASSLLVGVVLDVLGRRGHLEMVPDLTFRPYGQLVVWTAVLTNFSALPVAIYQATEQPQKVSALNAFSGISLLVLNLVFVAGLRQGALGVLRAGCASAATMAVVSTVLMMRMIDFVFIGSKLAAALLYCLPFVPHLLANWALAVSDRLILAKYVPPPDVARYALAYLLATAISLIGTSVTTPVTAAANRGLGNPATAKSIPPLGTYALLATIVAALLSSVCARELVRLLGPPVYGAAATFVPWVALGAVLNVSYIILSIGTWYSKKTGMVPVVTVVSVAANVGINLLLIPRYGVIVAPISTVIGYAISAVLHGFLARRNHNVPWEYKRWAVMTLAAALTFLSIRLVSIRPVVVAIVVKSAMTITVFGCILLLLRFASAGELAALRRVIIRRR